MANKKHCDDCGGFETTEGACNNCNGAFGTIIPGKGQVAEAFEKANVDMETAKKKDVFQITGQFENLPHSPKDNEYVCSQIATHMPENHKKQPILMIPIANHIYTIENHGFGDYRIIAMDILD